MCALTGHVVLVALLQSHVLQTILAYPQLSLFAILLWIGREVPSVNLVPAGGEGRGREDGGKGESSRVEEKYAETKLKMVNTDRNGEECALRRQPCEE